MSTSIGQHLAKLRRARGWSQAELARQAHVSQAYVSQVESGRRPNPSLVFAAQLATALGQPVTALLGIETPEQIAPVAPREANAPTAA